MSTIPHLRIVVLVCAVAVVGYAALSAWVVLMSGDAAQQGDVIGTWKSFAVLAVGFWIGSSSAGKAKPDEPQPKGTPDDPLSVTETEGRP